jgi:hypothetical protein
VAPPTTVLPTRGLRGAGPGSPWSVSETTNGRVSKVEAVDVEAGQMGQRYLAAGARVGMRLWAAQPPSEGKTEAARGYEQVG